MGNPSNMEAQDSMKGKQYVLVIWMLEKYKYRISPGISPSNILNSRFEGKQGVSWISHIAISINLFINISAMRNQY